MKFLQFYIQSLFVCLFQMKLFNGPEGSPAGNPANPATPTLEDLPKSVDEFTIDDIKGIMKEVAKESTKEQLLDLKKEMVDVHRKSIFPEIEGNFGEGGAEAAGGSIIDTNAFHKSYGGTPTHKDMLSSAAHPALPQGMVMGRQLLSNGGPFKRLSPEMETFAKLLKCRGNIQKAESHFNVKFSEHQEKIKVHYKAAGMNEGVVADGGAFVPVEYLATVIEFATAQSMILSKVWRLNMSSEVLRIPRLMQGAGNYFGGITLYSPGEGELKQSTKPTLERIELTAKKLIGLIYLTDELIADSMINVVNYVTGLFVRAFQYDIEGRVIRGTGAGNSPILGIGVDPNVNVVARQNAGQIGYDDIMNLDAALDENFSNLTWMTRKATQIELMKLVDLNNRPLFVTNYGELTGGSSNPPSMITYPVFKTRNMPALGNEGDLILGDLNWFLLAIRQDLTVDESDHVRFVYDEKCIRFVMRLDGMPAIPDAFARLGDVES